MKWFKHDTDANMDAKLQEVLLDYGLEGYGLYWYCIELIAGKVGAENLTFSLEHDARIIARNTGSTPQKITEMMTRFIEVGLFEDKGGLITCMRLAKRLDKSMTSNPEMRAAIEGIRNNHDSVMTQSAKPMQDKTRLEENRVDKNKTDKKKVIKPESFKQFFTMYPPNKKGGTDATAWKKAKGLGFTDNDFILMTDDIEQRKALMPSWYATYAMGITKYLDERIWLTPITPEKQDASKFVHTMDALQGMQLSAPQQPNGLLNHD